MTTTSAETTKSEHRTIIWGQITYTENSINSRKKIKILTSQLNIADIQSTLSNLKSFLLIPVIIGIESEVDLRAFKQKLFRNGNENGLLEN